jgi:hypothetical protein
MSYAVKLKQGTYLVCGYDFIPFAMKVETTGKQLVLSWCDFIIFQGNHHIICVLKSIGIAHKIGF